VFIPVTTTKKNSASDICKQPVKEDFSSFNQNFQGKTAETVLARLLALEEKLAQTEAELS
jgi:hypothetical protein